VLIVHCSSKLPVYCYPKSSIDSAWIIIFIIVMLLKASGLLLPSLSDQPPEYATSAS